jgi:hypothetical protein
MHLLDEDLLAILAMYIYLKLLILYIPVII